MGDRVTVRLPPGLLADVDRQAHRAGMSRAAYLRALIAAALPADDVDRAQIRRLLALSPAERVARHSQVTAQLSAVGAAGAVRARGTKARDTVRAKAL